MQRKNRFVIGAGVTYVAYAITIIFSVISVPISLEYFGQEIYGAYAIIGTILTYLSNSNLGIPKAVAIIAAKAIDKTERIKIFIKSFYLLIILSILFLFICFLLSFTSFYGVILGKVPENIVVIVKEALYISIIFYFVNVSFELFMSGFITEQRVYIERIYSIINSISSFVALLIIVYWKGNLIHIVLLRGLLKLCISIISSTHYLIFFQNSFYIVKKVFKTTCKSSNYEFTLKSIFDTSLKLFISGLAAVIVWHTDNLIITNFLGISYVTPYSITFNFITIFFAIFTSINAVLSPMYGEAFALNNYEWITHVYNESIAISSRVAGFIWIGYLSFAQLIIKLWVGEKGDAGFLTIFALGGYGFLLSYVHTHASLYNSLNKFKNSIYIGWSEALANFTFSIILVRWLGIGGVALGTFLGSLFTVFWLLPFEIHKQTDYKVKLDFQKIIFFILFIIVPILSTTILANLLINDFILKSVLSICIVIIYSIISYKTLDKKAKEIVLSTIFKKRRSVKNY